MAVLAGAFAAGVAGSGHCLAMCGGIATALARGPTRRASLANAGLSALGRATSYALAGALVATLTASLGLLLEAATLRNVAAWASALALLAVGLKLVGVFEWRAVERFGARAWTRLAPATRMLGRVPRVVRPFAAGMLWGWLPCGMAYTMLLLAAASGDPFAGAARMAAFAAGTMPALALSAGLFGAATAAPRGPWLRRAAGAALLLAGVLLLPVAPWAAGAGGPAEHGHQHHHGG
ncbi:MAG TPA: sulfite exporter TauE/SafE family protein [Xanthomonadales bacterium]|nr:sulfite exporter TauE/SafE family protein [Xanthomonadales bacterium]